MKHSHASADAARDRDLQATPIRVFLVDDHPAVVEALSLLLDFQEDMTVCGTAANAEEALAQIAAAEPDVVISDILLQDTHGLGMVGQIRDRHPKVRIVVFSMCQEQAFAERAIRAGALGYVMKTAPTQAVVEAVRTAFQDEVYVSPQVASRMLSRIIDRERAAGLSVIESLTDHELLVFEMLGHSYSLRDVAQCLGVSRKTVVAYQRHAQKKLGAPDTVHLVQKACSWVNGQLSVDVLDRNTRAGRVPQPDAVAC